jgi:regulator of protease activity HflC (stomatin/prohibitin superfamily)
MSMAVIYKKFQTSEYIILVKNGRVIKEGKGLTVLCDNMHTNIQVVPTIAYDGTFGFEDVITADFQSVFVQGVLTYMINDYTKAADAFDFGYSRNYELKKTAVMELLTKRINNVIKAIVIREVGSRKIRDIIRISDEMSAIISEGLQTDGVIQNLGIKILSVNILGIMPKPETKKALEAVAREEILKEQDDAIYMRRNAAIDQERLIKENELNTEIKMADKEKELVELKAENDMKKADLEAYAIERVMKAYENVDVALIEALALTKMEPGTIMAKAFMEMGENAGKIGTLNMTPDLLETIVGK